MLSAVGKGPSEPLARVPVAAVWRRRPNGGSARLGPLRSRTG
jgi:hypothetical protein